MPKLAVPPRINLISCHVEIPYKPALVVALKAQSRPRNYGLHLTPVGTGSGNWCYE